VNDRRLEPPSGHPPPTSASLGSGKPLELSGLAREICQRYRREFPDEEERYGEAGYAWCVHDNHHLLNWAAGAVSGMIEMNPEVAWLAKVLEARHFPIARLARNLEIAANVARTEVGGGHGEQLAAVLANAAAFVRSRDTFLD
jgi:hypothetical protein